MANARPSAVKAVAERGRMISRVAAPGLSDCHERVCRAAAAADLEATMRDDTTLRADTYRPTGGGPWPVLPARTPYGKQDPHVLARLDPFRAARRGYLVIIQDCRGTTATTDPIVRPDAHL
jgi:predicted acyl esterase